MSQLAQQLGIPRRSIDQRIRSGVIAAGPRPPMKLHLFPDAEAAVAAFRNLSNISCWKRVSGNGLRSPTDRRQATEVAIATDVLNRMLDLERPNYIRIV